MSERKYKIVKPFYCFHPEIKFNDKVRPAFYGVEWTVLIKDPAKPAIGIHCMRQVETEEQAEGLVLELQENGGEYAPWNEFDYTAWYLSCAYRSCRIDPKKH